VPSPCVGIMTDCQNVRSLEMVRTLRAVEVRQLFALEACTATSRRRAADEPRTTGKPLARRSRCCRRRSSSRALGEGEEEDLLFLL